MKKKQEYMLTRQKQKGQFLFDVPPKVTLAIKVEGAANKREARKLAEKYAHDCGLRLFLSVGKVDFSVVHTIRVADGKIIETGPQQQPLMFFAE
jgi:hypothetical protein